jgi:redox-sensing transcriptional repressor
VKVFSDNLADAVGATAAQVRKDFSLFGISGNKRGGYQIDALIEKLNGLLGKSEMQEVVIVGAGHIGTALMRYRGFEKDGMKIAACFDIDPAKYNHHQGAGIPVLPLDDLRDFIKARHIKIGVIAVPEIAAQQVLDQMTCAGIKGILNFAPIRLKGASDCVINNVNLVLELETVIYYIVNGLNKTIGEISEDQKS